MRQRRFPGGGGGGGDSGGGARADRADDDDDTAAKGDVDGRGFPLWQLLVFALITFLLGRLTADAF